MDALRESVESASLDRRKAGPRADGVETSQAFDPQLAEHDSFSVNEVPDEPVLSKRELRILGRHQSRIDAKAYKKTANAEIERILAERAGRSGAVEPRRTAQSMFEPHRSAIVSGVVAFSFVITVGVFAYVLWDR